MRPMIVHTALAAGLVLAGIATTTHAGAITFNGEAGTFSGTGFGNVHNLLTVHQNNSEFGAIKPPDEESGNAANTSQILAVSDLLADGITVSNFCLVLNVNEPGSSDTIFVNDFSLLFYSSNSLGAAPIDTLTFDTAPVGGLQLAPAIKNGTGSAGWIFDVDDTALASLFQAGNFIGMEILSGEAITSSFDGPENFFVANCEGMNPVPEPSTVAMALTALVPLGLMGLRRLRRRSNDA